MKSLTYYRSEELDDLKTEELGHYLRRLRNEALYAIDNSSGLGTSTNTPFILGCDVIDENGEIVKFINYFDVRDDTHQDNINILRKNGKTETINSWTLNYDKNLGLPTSLNDILIMLNKKNMEDDSRYTVNDAGFLIRIIPYNKLMNNNVLFNLSEQNIENQKRSVLISLINLLR